MKKPLIAAFFSAWEIVLDFLQVGLSGAGVVGLGLLGVAFNKPDDYLEVIDPIISWTGAVLACALLGCFFGTEWTLAALETSFDPLKSINAVSKARSLGSMLLVAQVIFTVFGLFNHALASKMRARARARTDSE